MKPASHPQFCDLTCLGCGPGSGNFKILEGFECADEFGNCESIQQRIRFKIAGSGSRLCRPLSGRVTPDTSVTSPSVSEVSADTCLDSNGRLESILLGVE